MRFRKIIVFTLIIFSVIAGTLSLLAVMMGPRIKELAVQELNRYLTVPVQAGEIDFSLIRKFPYAGVSFKDISSRGVNVQGNRENLFSAREVFLLFSWWNVFSDELRLRKITVEDASVFLYSGKDGEVNYRIFRKSDGKDARFTIELEDVLLRNTAVRYVDAGAGHDYSFFTSRMDCSGKFTNTVFDLSGKGNLLVERFRISGVNYIDAKETAVDLNIQVDTGKDRYEVRDSRIRIAEMDLDVSGFFQTRSAGNLVDFKISSSKAGLKELVSLVPSRFTARASGFNYSGSVYFDLMINNTTALNKTPVVSVSFGTTGANLAPKGSDYRLKDIRFRGDFISRSATGRPVERLSIRGFNAVLEGQPVSGELLAEDFSDPFVRLQARAKFDLDVLSMFYMPDTVSSMSGTLVIDAALKGYASGKGGWTSSGKVTALNAGFVLKEARLPFSGINGDVELKGNRLEVRGLNGKRGETDFRINGSVDNVYAFVLSRDQMVNADIALETSLLDLGQLLDDRRDSPSDTSFRFSFDPRISAVFDFRIGELVFRKFRASSVTGRLSLKKSILTGSGLTFTGFGGRNLLNGSMDASRPDSVLIICDAEVNRINIRDLFYQLGNFGQDVIVDRNVQGKVTASVQFASTWSSDLRCNTDKVYARGKIVIEDGELIDFQPMLVLSRYLKSADLRRIRFQTLQNEIEISSRTIRIPAMEIKSSVLDLTASGTHTFDNIVNYDLQLYFSQIMGRKVRQNNTEFGTIEDDGLGRMRLFLTMKGPLSDPVIKVNRTAIEQKIVREIKKEKQDIRKILNKEFGWFKKDSAAVSTERDKPAGSDELELDTSPEENTP